MKYRTVRVENKVGNTSSLVEVLLHWTFTDRSPGRVQKVKDGRSEKLDGTDYRHPQVNRE